MEFRCAQDEREEELLKEGFVKADKAYFRIGRAIFVIDVLKKSFTEEEAAETPLGLAAKIQNPRFEFDEKKLEMLQSVFGSTGFLRIICEGDPDCGFAGNDEVLLTGFRGGLDDVIVENKLLWSVHGSDPDIMRNFADYLYQEAEWLHVPDWDTFDGHGYRIKSDKTLEDKMKRISGAIRDLAFELEHLEDIPEEVRKKWEQNNVSDVETPS